jgi:hypothetical protein
MKRSDAIPFVSFVVKANPQRKDHMKTGTKVKLRADVLVRHARSVPARLGYSREQFDWRATLRRLSGVSGEITRTFPGSKHVTVEFKEGAGGTPHIIGIDHTELEPFVKKLKAKVRQVEDQEGEADYLEERKWFATGPRDADHIIGGEA